MSQMCAGPFAAETSQTWVSWSFWEPDGRARQTAVLYMGSDWIPRNSAKQMHAPSLKPKIIWPWVLWNSTLVALIISSTRPAFINIFWIRYTDTFQKNKTNNSYSSLNFKERALNLNVWTHTWPKQKKYKSRIKESVGRKCVGSIFNLKKKKKIGDISPEELW